VRPQIDPRRTTTEAIGHDVVMEVILHDDDLLDRLAARDAVR